MTVTAFVHEHMFTTSTEGWVLVPPGELALAPVLPPTGIEHGSTRAEGMRFFQGQLNNKSSAYRMPKAESCQRDWEAWFSRMNALQKLFPALSASIIIPMTTGFMAVDDKRIFGWLEKANEMEHRKQEPTLKDFLDHVRSQVMANAVTRREAYLELEGLTRDFRHIEDCQALSTRLQQLWLQMYPHESTEIEPIGKVEAMRRIHTLLQNVGNKYRGNRTLMAQAWANFNCDHTALFVTYVDSELHTSKLATETLSQAFLKEVCTQLQQAHRMSVQVGPNSSTALDSNDRARSAQHRYQAAALRTSQSTPRVATWVNHTGGSKKRNRAEDRAGPSRSGSQRSRGASGSQGGASTPRSPSSHRPTPPPGMGGSAGKKGSVELETDYRIIFQRMREMRCTSRDPLDREVGHLRGALPGLKKLPYAEAVQAVLDGGCTLCLEKGHVGRNCPFLEETGPLKQRIRIYNNLLRAARRKQDD